MFLAIKKAISLSFICENKRKGHGSYILQQNRKYGGKRKGERRKYTADFIHLNSYVYSVVCVCRKRQRELIQTGVFELVERTGGMPVEGTYEMQDIYLIHVETIALKHRR